MWSELSDASSDAVQSENVVTNDVSDGLACNIWALDSFASAGLARVSDAVIGIDPAWNIRYLNLAAEQMLGVSREESLSVPLSDLLVFATEDAQNFPLKNPVERCLGNGIPASGSLRVSATQRAEISLDVRVTASPIREQGDALSGVVVVISDTSELRRMNARLSYEARHDALTSLVNRRELIARVERLLSSRRLVGSQHTLLYIDLDRFKVVNDSCGHGAGDELLRSIGTLLKNTVRENDTVARVGGDEFVILLEQCSVQRGRAVAATLLDQLSDFRFDYDEHSFRVGASIGVVPILRGYSAFDEVIAAADSACYEAKRSGRQCVIVHHQTESGHRSDRAKARRVLCIEDAIDRNLISLFKQNIVDTCKPDKLVGIEFLMRTRNEQGDSVLPDVFLPTAERMDLMNQIDRLVVTRALDWMHENASLVKGLEFCSINLSPASLRSDAFLEHVEIAVKKSHVSGEKICFEVTENIVIDDLNAIAQRMARLREQGCLFAIDDFGSGTHRFDALRELPVDLVKIDGALATRMCDDLVDRTIVKSINDVSHLLGKRTVIEHIEDEVIHAEAEQLEIDYCQGRLFDIEALA